MDMAKLGGRLSRWEAGAQFAILNRQLSAVISHARELESAQPRASAANLMDGSRFTR